MQFVRCSLLVICMFGPIFSLPTPIWKPQLCDLYVHCEFTSGVRKLDHNIVGTSGLKVLNASPILQFSSLGNKRARMMEWAYINTAYFYVPKKIWIILEFLEVYKLSTFLIVSKFYVLKYSNEIEKCHAARN